MDSKYPVGSSVSSNVDSLDGVNVTAQAGMQPEARENPASSTNKPTAYFDGRALAQEAGGLSTVLTEQVLDIVI